MDVHLSLVKRDLTLAGCKVKLHCHCLTVDANNRVKVARLAEFMRSVLTDYAIPKSKLADAKARDIRFKNSSAVTSLHYEALNLFTDLKKTGEGGEMLLYLLAERFLKIPQVLCKMDLKTDTSMHYHGADGVYATVSTQGIIKLYWGESKIYQDVGAAVRDCLESLTPFLVEPDNEKAGRERDIILLSDKADLGDVNLTAAFKKYFDKTSPKSNRVQYCGIALIGFDADFYPNENTSVTADSVVAAAEKAMSVWAERVRSRIEKHKLENIEIEFLCIPLPSAKDFRNSFLKVLGHPT